MTRRRLGIAIGAEHVYATLVVGDTVRWYSTARLDGTETIAVVLAQLLAELPLSRVVRTHAYVALGPRLAQVKRLEGLPPIDSSRLISQLVRENASAFFLQKSPRLLIPPVSIRRDATVWGAALDADAVNAIVGAVRASGIRLVVVTPALRTVGSSDLSAALATLGDDGPAYQDAYNATRTSRRTPFAWRPVETGTTATRRLLRVVAGVIVASSIAFAVLAPALRDALYVRRTAGEARRGQPMRLQIERTAGEMARVTQLLNRIESFRAERGSITRLLGAIAQAIPDSTAIVSLRIDSVGGNFVAIATRVTDVLPALGSIDGVLSPHIAGSVTREALSGGVIHVERAAFRFQRPRQTTAPSTIGGGAR